VRQHYTDDELTLYYYGEGRRRATIEKHLETCASCASLYREIAGTLAIVAAPEVPERGDQYGLEVWQRIRHKLPERDARSDATTAPAAAIASSARAAGDSRRILLTSVADHLDRSERVLTDVMNAPDRGDISTEQRWAEDLLDASRLYRQDAMDAGEQSVAAVLDDLERSLLEIVHSPSKVSTADLDDIRRRIDAATLLFKVRVMSDELRKRDDAPGVAVPRTTTRKIS